MLYPIKHPFTRGGLEKISEIIGISFLKPVSMTFDITDRCQLKCLTCTKWKTPLGARNKELSSKDWKAVILRMKEWMGEFSFFFAGGEPFLRKDILEICSFALANSIHPNIITNGCGFAYLARAIVESGLESLWVSLNGIDPEIHDTTRGIKHSFQKTMQFIKNINRYRKSIGSNRPKLVVNTILMPFNCKEASRIVKWSHVEGIDAIHFQPLDPPGSFHPYPIHSYRIKHSREDFIKLYRGNLLGSGNKGKINSVIRDLVSLKEQGFSILNSKESLRRIGTYYDNPETLVRKCRMDISSFNIDPYGNVRMCFDMKPIGNILETSPKKLYNNRKAQKSRLKIVRCQRLCHWAIL